MKSTRLGRAIRLTTLAAIAAPATVFAGGFSLNEQSASAMGVANAGAVANPENATTVYFNPAGMSQLQGTNISFGAAVLDIDAEAKSANATNQLGQPVNGRNGGDIADLAVLPNFYMTHEISESVDVGFGIHAPYGLAADYDDDFAGRFFADKTELTAMAFSPSISVNNGQGLSMGASINILYVEGRLTKFQDNSGRSSRAPNGALPGTTLPPQGYADIEGDDIGVTFQVGFLYELNDRTQFGLTAQTGTEFELDGDATFTDLVVIPQQGSAAGFAIPINSTEPAKVPLSIPESISAGLKHKAADDFTVLAGATYTRWSRFEALNIYGTDSSKPVTSGNPGGPNGQLTHIPEYWQNTWQFNLGGVWQATPAWAFKAGYAWDESPVDDFITARIPSSDRHWLTLGTQWKNVQSGWTVDAAVGTLLFTDDPKLNEFNYVVDADGDTQKNAGDPNSNYKGEYELDAWSASLQVSKAF